VGDIEDEHDTIDLIEKDLGNNEYIFSGRLEIDYLNEKYRLNIPEEDDFETLAGFVLFHHGSIPRINDVIRIGRFLIKVLRASTTKLELVNLKID
jgi:CBS domain containing-hemolysin-like protein